MRKSMLIIPALLMAAAVVAPCVRADSVSFTCTGDNNNAPVSPPPYYGPCFEAAPTAPNVTFSSSGSTVDITWYSQTFTVTLPGTWQDTDSYSWLASNMGFFIYDNTDGGIGVSSGTINTNLPTGQGLSEFGTLTFTPGSGSPGNGATPEPDSLLLLGTGLLGFAPFLRRKFARL